MIQLRQGYNGNYVIDVPEWNNLKEKFRLFLSNKENILFQNRLYVALSIYLKWFIKYCDTELRTASYSMDQVASQLFITKIKSEGQLKNYLRCSLFVSRLYAQHILNLMRIDHIGRYENLIAVMESDFEWLIINYECVYHNEKRPIHSSVGSRKHSYPHDVFILIEHLFNIEDVPDITNLDFFSLKPNSIFLIRQLLELVGKNLIGFADIVDENGTASHQFTQVSWTFLAEKVRNKRWSIELPIKCSTINKLNSWTNSFVHAANFNMIWQQYYALVVIKSLMKPPVKYVDVCGLRKQISLEYGDFRINGYYWLRKDFEEYVRNGSQRIKNAKVVWNEIEKVGAYVKDYGHPNILFLIDTKSTTRESMKIGQYLNDSAYLDMFLSKIVVDHGDFPKLSFECLKNSIHYFTNVIKCLKQKNPVAAYVNPRINGLGFFVDFFLVLCLKLKMKRPITKTKRVSGNYPIILHLYNTKIKERLQSKIYDYLYRHMFNNVTVMIHDFRQYEELKTYVKETDILICPNGVKEHNHGMIPKRNNQIPRIIYVLDVAECNGFLDLLDACKILQNKGVTFECIFVRLRNVGLTKECLASEIEKRSLQNMVQCLENLSDEDIHKYLGIVDIFVYPTYDSNVCVPIVFLEAMEQALPCIATNEFETSSIIEEGVTGFIVDKQNPNMLSERIECLIKNADLRKEMGVQAKLKFEREFTLQIFEKNFMNCLNQII